MTNSGPVGLSCFVLDPPPPPWPTLPQVRARTERERRPVQEIPEMPLVNRRSEGGQGWKVVGSSKGASHVEVRGGEFRQKRGLCRRQDWDKK